MFHLSSIIIILSEPIFDLKMIFLFGFRNSKLTHLLQDSLGRCCQCLFFDLTWGDNISWLHSHACRCQIMHIAGGDSKTLMFVQISPSEQDLSETLSSLNFATRVRGVELGPARKQIDTSELQKMKVMVGLRISCLCHISSQLLHFFPFFYFLIRILDFNFNIVYL